MNFTWFMAQRLYSQGGGSRRASRSAITIATAGVAVGLAVMIIAISVVLGFKSEIQNKAAGIGSHIQILNYQSSYTAEHQPIVINDTLCSYLKRIPQVVGIQRFCQKSGMLKTDESFQGVVFRGIDEDYDLTFLRTSLTEGEIAKPFSSKENTGRLVISQRLARELNLHVGNRVFAYFFDKTLRARRFDIEAIYATNLEEFDSKLVFCDYKTAHQLSDYQDDQSSGAEVNIADLAQLDVVQSIVSDVVNHRQDHYGAYYSAPSIKDLNPHIFAWLDLLDVNVVVILLLMIAVAGFTTISGLLIIILERTQFIGVMKALGSTNRSLRHLFIYYAIFIIGRGMFIGNILGIGLCLLQKHLGLISLDASTYYVSQVPILLSWPLIVLVNIITFVVATLSLVIPSFVVSNIHPARSIRFE